jgi:hypothetical protein
MITLDESQRDSSLIAAPIFIGAVANIKIPEPRRGLNRKFEEFIASTEQPELLPQKQVHLRV